MTGTREFWPCDWVISGSPPLPPPKSAFERAVRDRTKELAREIEMSLYGAAE